MFVKTKPVTSITIEELTIEIRRGESRKVYSSARGIDRLLAILNSNQYDRKVVRGKVSGVMCIQATRKLDDSGFFPITRLHRDDLEHLGFDASKVDDFTMEQIASDMADAYTGGDTYWIDLEIIARDKYNVPRNEDEDWDENGDKDWFDFLNDEDEDDDLDRGDELVPAQ